LTPAEQAQSKARDTGATAWHMGATAEDNPYPLRNRTLRAAWMDGWCNALNTRPLILTARVESIDGGHARVGVWQNHGKAGTLVVDADMADAVVAAITTPAAPDPDADIALAPGKQIEPPDFTFGELADRLRATNDPGTDDDITLAPGERFDENNLFPGETPNEVRE
jgi:hypothetical protein